MKRSVLFAAAMAAFSLDVAGAASAQTCQTTGTLTEIVGTVMVDKGQGFVPGFVGASLDGGDKVAVQGPGSAVIDFGSDRTVTVPGSTTEIVRAPGCGLVMDSTTGLVVATVVIGGGIGAAIALSNDSGDNRTVFLPVSP